MELTLKKKPKNPIIIEGFPGFGLIGTITTEFLIEQLNAELIGTIKFEDMPAMIAIHEGKVIEPIGIFYDKRHNLVILHVITSMAGVEWAIADLLVKLARELEAKEILCLEGVGSPVMREKVKCYFYSSSEAKKKIFEKLKVEPMKEGIILGVTGSLMLETHRIPISCIFAETHSSLPDSKAAAAVIEVLDKYLGLKIDVTPLIEQAEKFEEKIRKIVEQGKVAAEEQKKKRLWYVG